MRLLDKIPERQHSTHRPIDHFARIYSKWPKQSDQPVAATPINAGNKNQCVTTYPNVAVEKVARTAVVASTLVS